MGHVACALLLALAEVQVEARAELRGGEAPAFAGQAPESTARSTLQPEAGLVLRAREGQTRLHYGPRLTLRAPSPAGTEQPLVMHLAGVEHEQRLLRGVRGRAEVSTSFGDVDYAGLSQTLGPGQSTLPTLTRLLSLGGGASVEVREVQRWILQTNVSVAHQRPLDPGAPPSTGAALQQSTSVGLAQSARHALTRREDVTLALGVSDQSLSSGLHLVAFEPGATLHRRLSRASTLELGLGVVIAGALARPAGAGEPAIASPVGLAGLRSRVRPARGVVLEGNASLAASWAVDPVLVTSLTRGTASAGVFATFHRDLRVGASAQFSTSVSRAPLPGDPDETVLRAEVPVRYRLSPLLAVEVGGRYSDRGHHLAANTIGLHQRELWLYLQLVASAHARVY